MNSSSPAEPLNPGTSAKDLQVTVALHERSQRALEQLCKSTGYSMTDAINRAVQIYAFIEENSADGSQIIVRHPSGRAEVVKFLS